MTSYIRNKYELKDAYIVLRLIESANEVRSEAAREEAAHALKRSIRDYHRREADRLAGMPRGYCDDFGYCTSFEYIAPADWSEEEAEERFMEELFIPRPNSMYDCTGQWFTTRHHLLRYKGDWWVIHHTAMDI